jgi:hypothetical protein
VTPRATVIRAVAQDRSSDRRMNFSPGFAGQ